MGTITASTMATLNGVAGRPEEWQFDYVSEPMMRIIADSLQASAGLLLGRNTYDEFAEYWPAVSPETNPMAHAMNALPKYVVSSALSETTWANSTIVRDARAVSELKAGLDGELTIIGSPTLVRSLLEAGLVDQLDLMMYPLLVAAGVRLFDGIGSRVPLTLTHCSELPKGVLHLTLRPASGSDATEVNA